MAEENKSDAKKNNHLISHYKLRQALGVLGILLPVLVVVIEKTVGNAEACQPSISHYFYSKAHVLFIGALCIMGALFCTYYGEDNKESRIANITGICAFLVAIFPTGQSGFLPACQSIKSNDIIACISCSDNFVEKDYHSWYMYIHFGSAVLMFIMIAIFCWFYLTKPEQDEHDKIYLRKKKNRNKYYRFCAVGILISLLVCYLSFREDKILPYNTVYFCETICLWLFGSAWLLKGSYGWKDSRNPMFKMLYNVVR